MTGYGRDTRLDEEMPVKHPSENNEQSFIQQTGTEHLIYVRHCSRCSSILQVKKEKKKNEEPYPKGAYFLEKGTVRIISKLSPVIDWKVICAIGKRSNKQINQAT